MNISIIETNVPVFNQTPLIREQKELLIQKVKDFSESYIVSCALKTFVLSGFLRCFSLPFATTAPICFGVVVCISLTSFALHSIKIGINKFIKNSLYYLTKVAQVINDIFRELYEWICTLSFSPFSIANQKFETTYPIPNMTSSATHKEVINGRRVFISSKVQPDITLLELPAVFEGDVVNECAQEQTSIISSNSSTILEKDVVNECAQEQTSVIFSNLSTILEKDALNNLPRIQFSTQLINFLIEDKACLTEESNIIKSHFLNHKGIVKTFDVTTQIHSFNKYKLTKPLHSHISISHNRMVFAKSPNNPQALNTLRLGIKLLQLMKK